MSFIAKQTEYLSFGGITINKFPKPSLCGENLNFCQPTEQFDDIPFQFKVSESTDLITNGSFTGSSAGWVKVGWVRIPSSGSLTPDNFFMEQTNALNALSQKGILTINDFYRVTVTISNYQGGAINIGGGTGSSLANIALSLTSNGTFTGFFQYNEPGGDGDFIVQGIGPSIGTQIDDIEVIKIGDISDYTIQIHDAVTFALIDTVPSNKLSLNENTMTVDFNWADDVSVPNGCVVLRILDGSNIFEDTFATNQGWTLGAQTVISGGLMTYSSIGLSNSSVINNIFTVGESYTITYTASGVTGTGTVQVICGRTAGTIRSGAGTFIETLVCTDRTVLQFNFSGSNLSTVSIDNVTISKENNIDGQSECLQLDTSHDCTLLFKWSNDETWGGFDYSEGFEHKMRVECKFRGVSYPRERNNGEDSKGLKLVDYSSLRKSPTLDINWAAIHIHDAIAAHFEQDNRDIDGVSYFLEDEYEPSSPNDSVVIFKDLMTARIELEVSDQPNQINRNIGGV